MVEHLMAIAAEGGLTLGEVIMLLQGGMFVGGFAIGLAVQSLVDFIAWLAAKLRNRRR